MHSSLATTKSTMIAFLGAFRNALIRRVTNLLRRIIEMIIHQKSYHILFFFRIMQPMADIFNLKGERHSSKHEIGLTFQMFGLKTNEFDKVLGGEHFRLERIHRKYRTSNSMFSTCSKCWVRLNLIRIG